MAKGTTLPHFGTIVGFCIAAIAGYAVFSWWVVFVAQDAAMTGDVIGTWKSFAVLAFGFWLGSSSGGKTKEDGPRPVEVVNLPGDPVPVSTEPKP